MDFDEAMAAHSEWRMKLANYIRKPDKSLSASIVSKDNQCALGKWLYAEGQRHGVLPEYTQLVEAHKRFHAAAGIIIARADKGENVTEEVTLGAVSDYSRASVAVAMAIMGMKRKV